MANYSTFQTSNSEIQDPALKGFVNHVTDILKTSVSQSLFNRSKNTPFSYKKLNVGKKQVKEYSSVGEVVDAWLATKRPEQIKTLEHQAGSSAYKSADPFVISNLKALNIKSPKYILEQVDVPSTFKYVDDDLLLKRFANIFDIATVSTPGTVVNPAPVLTLKLNLKRVRCIDETNPEWLGSDEISAGGVTIDDKEVEAKISQFGVGNFNDGSVKNFSPAKVLKSFRLDSANPSTFVAFLTLAEKDNGGFADFLTKLYEAIKGELTAIISALGAAAGAAIGAAVGGTIGTTIGGPIGSIIGIVAGLILGALIGWLVGALSDDIFEPQITGINLESNAAFTGPAQTLLYRDFGGQYAADIFWSAS